MQGSDDPSASCFEGIRFKVVNGVNINYNIVANSLQYDPRFNLNGLPGLLYAAGSVTNPSSNLFFGQSSTSPNFRDASRKCPAGVTGDNLPTSFKVVVDGGGIPSSALNNFLSLATGAPNLDNVGTHWIMLPDRGVCVGNPALATQNDGSYVQHAPEPADCSTSAGCFTNRGPPIFANPASAFRRDAVPPQSTYDGPWEGKTHDGSA